MPFRNDSGMQTRSWSNSNRRSQCFLAPISRLFHSFHPNYRICNTLSLLTPTHRKHIQIRSERPSKKSAFVRHMRYAFIRNRRFNLNVYRKKSVRVCVVCMRALRNLQSNKRRLGTLCNNMKEWNVCWSRVSRKNAVNIYSFHPRKFSGKYWNVFFHT